MSNVCFYFQLHQPFRLGNFEFQDLGKSADYFSESKSHNGVIFSKVADKSYVPMLSLLLKLVRVHPDFCFGLSLSGVFVEQALTYRPEVIEIIKNLVDSGQVEIFAETYYHSLAGLYSPDEFREQVKLHHQLMVDVFNYEPQTFRNTELIYSNHIAYLVSTLGYSGMLTEAVDRYLDGSTKRDLHQANIDPFLPVMLKHAPLSDDVAFRFSNKDWESFPLISSTYLDWITQYGDDDFINLFMDFETFGEHQWSDTGIFEFFEHFIQLGVSSPEIKFVTPKNVFSKAWQDHLQGKDVWVPTYDVPEPISWADIDRDLSAWNENQLQQDSLRAIYELEDKIKSKNDEHLLHIWRKLQISDHFYYMCTKWAADGDVHAYFSPYNSPLEGYRRYSTVLSDLRHRLLFANNGS